MGASMSLRGSNKGFDEGLLNHGRRRQEYYRGDTDQTIGTRLANFELLKGLGSEGRDQGVGRFGRGHKKVTLDLARVVDIDPSLLELKQKCLVPSAMTLELGFNLSLAQHWHSTDDSSAA
jgi:hypothetical protein